MGKQIDRYVVEEYGGWLTQIKTVEIRDRLSGDTVCRFNTGNKDLNKELAKYCLERIENHKFL